ncbi:hypothetical protein A2U01_0056510, partial [Trifolium medium]|nr:hypothetical protein [Trifolium medium]
MASRLTFTPCPVECYHKLAVVQFSLAKGGRCEFKVDGVSLEGVQPIRQAVFSHFASHFKASTVER